MSSLVQCYEVIFTRNDGEELTSAYWAFNSQQAIFFAGTEYMKAGYEVFNGDAVDITTRIIEPDASGRYIYMERRRMSNLNRYAVTFTTDVATEEAVVWATDELEAVFVAGQVRGRLSPDRIQTGNVSARLDIEGNSELDALVVSGMHSKFKYIDEDGPSPLV